MMINGEILLVILIIIGLIGRSPIITTAACILLIVKLVHLERFLPSMERRGLELGLLFLTLAVLVPFANEKIGYRDILQVFSSWPGILALVGGAVATYMNAKGLEVLKTRPTTHRGSSDRFDIRHYLFARYTGWTVDGCRHYCALPQDLPIFTWEVDVSISKRAQKFILRIPILIRSYTCFHVCNSYLRTCGPPTNAV